MTVKTDATRAAVLGALRDLIDADYKDTRADVLDGLLTVHDELGVKTINVELPDGTKVATVTLTEPSDTVTVTDRAAFTKWVQTKTPEQVPEPADPVQRVVDAMKQAQAELFRTYNSGDGSAPDGEEVNEIIAHHVLAALGINPEPEPTRVNPSYEKKLLDSLIHGFDGEAVDPNTGEIVDGVTTTPAGQPTQFSMRYTKQGRAEIAAAWRQGRLGDVAEVPQLETTPQGV